MGQREFESGSLTAPSGASEAPEGGARSLLDAARLRRLIQRRASRAGAGPAPAREFERAVAGGASEVPYRADMERAFGQDFSGVRAHTGKGEPMAALGAEAAARGDEVAFASSQPTRETVAHELTHVVQQRRGGAAIAGKEEVSDPGDAAEREADHVSARAAAGERVKVAAAPTAGLHRKRPEGVYFREGAPLTEEEGRALIQRLVTGDNSALAELTLNGGEKKPENLEGKDSGEKKQQPADASEWGLGMGVEDDNKTPAAYIIHGGTGAVVWSRFNKPPEEGGLTNMLAHSHPRVGRDLGKQHKLADLMRPNNGMVMERMTIFPSSDDINFASELRQDHTVYTPYAVEPDPLGDGYNVLDAQQGAEGPRLAFRITDARDRGVPSMFKGGRDELRATAMMTAMLGDKPIMPPVAIRAVDQGLMPVQPIAALPNEAPVKQAEKKDAADHDDHQHEDDDEEKQPAITIAAEKEQPSSSAGGMTRQPSQRPKPAKKKKNKSGCLSCFGGGKKKSKGEDSDDEDNRI